jgi:hypothetical protein
LLPSRAFVRFTQRIKFNQQFYSISNDTVYRIDPKCETFENERWGAVNGSVFFGNGSEEGVGGSEETVGCQLPVIGNR